MNNSVSTRYDDDIACNGSGPELFPEEENWQANSLRGLQKHLKCCLRSCNCSRMELLPPECMNNDTFDAIVYLLHTPCAYTEIHTCTITERSRNTSIEA